MKKLFLVLQENGYSQTSLSVQKDNLALKLYERLGYKIIGKKADEALDEDYLMIKQL